MSSTANTQPVGARLHVNERVAAGDAEPALLGITGIAVRRDVLVVPIERMVVAGPVDLDPGEVAAQRDVGPAPARTTRVQAARARSARVQAARARSARAGRRHRAGRSTAAFRAWLMFVKNT